MLTKLMPDQVSKFWDIISYAMEQSLPPTVGENPDKMNNILMAALSGKLDIWASYEKGDKVNKFEGILATRFIYDDITSMKNLLIYAVYGYDKVSEDSWKAGLRTVLKYAASQKCQLIVAYTNVPRVVEVVNSLGGDTSFSFISFKVNELIKLFN
jgi:hypothetical protein